MTAGWSPPVSGEAPRSGFAFVDVETSGLNSSRDRVLSVSVVAATPSGERVGEFHSLVDPGCDPGPVWVHGLTRERLRGAPGFEAVVPQVSALLRDRVLVAHNAQFDYRFLHAESRRAASALPTTHRLCTIALSRRLDLPLDNMRLESVARYWQVAQRAAHDSRDDVRVLQEVFQHGHSLAARLGVALPVVPCGDGDRAAPVYPARVVRVPSVFTNPSWLPPAPLVQGMKVVISGPTAVARATLAGDLARAGLDVMNSVSSRTRLLVCNSAHHASGKADRARELGVPIVDETSLRALLPHVVPGRRLDEPRESRARSAQAGARGAAGSRAGSPVPAGPWSDRVVLVLGGDHANAAAARARLGDLGARVLVNLGARTTHVLALPGSDLDPRMIRVRDRGIPLLGSSDMTDVAPLEGAPVGQSSAMPATGGLGVVAVTHDPPVVLSRGAVIDTPSEFRQVTVSAQWSNAEVVVDLVAFALQPDETVESDDDFVFYNAPSSPDGGVRLTIDGPAQQGVDIDFEALPEGCDRVRIAAVIDGDEKFAAVGAIGLQLSGSDGSDFASAVLDAATEERSLIIAEVYRRGDTWRARAIGQGYGWDLRQLAEAHGVDVE